jgi:hypothetical protein
LYLSLSLYLCISLCIFRFLCISLPLSFILPFFLSLSLSLYLSIYLFHPFFALYKTFSCQCNQLAAKVVKRRPCTSLLMIIVFEKSSFASRENS